MLRFTGLVKLRDYTPPIYQKSTNQTISYTLKPNIQEKAFRSVIRTNSLGFRSSELEGEKQTIAVLGDSIIFGYGVENSETLPARLNELLPVYNVLNAGTPGYHIEQEAALYKEKIKPLNPAALILVFYWNDFERSTSQLDDDNVLRAEGWQPQEKKCNPIQNGVLGVIPGKCWLDLHSAFYKGMKNYVNTKSGIQQRDKKRENATQGEVEEKITQEDLNRYSNTLQLIEKAIPRLFVIWPDSALHEEVRPKMRAIAESQGYKVLDLYDHFGNEMETLN